MPLGKEEPKKVNPPKRVTISPETKESRYQEHLRRVAGPAKTLRVGGK